MYNVSIPDPGFGSNLTSIVVDLEKLRSRMLRGEIPPYIFFQIKDIFQILETLGSARIEGNNTTLSDYVEKIIDNAAKEDEQGLELNNIEAAIDFIEDNATQDGFKIDRAFVSQLHTIVTKDLTPPERGEGSRNPGLLRGWDVEIKKSTHKPPSHTILKDVFDEFLVFINQDLTTQYQLLMVAIAHHYFMHIHPYDNGNGRLGRLLTYTLLIKLGFNVVKGRIINPSAIFYTDRDKYYEMLAKADSLDDEDLLDWSEYFLSGLKNQIEKIDRILQREYTRDHILIPTVKFALDRKLINKEEHSILNLIIRSKYMAIKSSELGSIGIKTSAQKSYAIKRMREKKMVIPVQEGKRMYTINFANNYLLRGFIKVLQENDFISDFLNNNQSFSR